MGGFLIDSIALQLTIKACFMVYGYMSGQWKDNRKESKCFGWGGRITLCRMVKTPLMVELTGELKKSALARSGRTVQVRKKSWYQGLELKRSL